MPWEKRPNAGVGTPAGGEGVVVGDFGNGDAGAAAGRSSLVEVFLRMRGGGRVG